MSSDSVCRHQRSCSACVNALAPDRELFFFNQKVLILFIFLHETICCRCSLEVPHSTKTCCGCSLEVPHSTPRWLRWMRRPTGDQEVVGSTPAEVSNILSWRLIMNYFLRSFSPFKKGSCQFLAKECAQYWLTA